MTATPDDLARLVKPLGWQDGGSAEFPLCAMGYCIEHPRHDYARLTGNGIARVFRGEGAKFRAKAMAQADYTARILAALDTDALRAMLADRDMLMEALVGVREIAHSLAHSEFDGVWPDEDFAALTADADAVLAKIGGAK